MMIVLGGGDSGSSDCGGIGNGDGGVAMWHIIKIFHVFGHISTFFICKHARSSKD